MLHSGRIRLQGDRRESVLHPVDVEVLVQHEAKREHAHDLPNFEGSWHQG